MGNSDGDKGDEIWVEVVSPYFDCVLMGIKKEIL